MFFKGLFGPNEEIKGAHLEDGNNRVMPSFGPDDRPVLAELSFPDFTCQISSCFTVQLVKIISSLQICLT